MSDIVPGVATYDISDHLPIFMILKKVEPKQAFKDYKVRNMKFFQAQTVIVDSEEQLLSNLDFVNHTSMNSQMILLNQTFHAVLEVHAPLYSASSKQKKLLRKPWSTTQTCNLSKRKNKMYSKGWSSKDSQDYVIYKQYKNCRKRAFFVVSHSWNFLVPCVWFAFSATGAICGVPSL